jgi:hypothetical protein
MVAAPFTRFTAGVVPSAYVRVIVPVGTGRPASCAAVTVTCTGWFVEIELVEEDSETVVDALGKVTETAEDVEGA